MKAINIMKKLEKNGYKVTEEKYHYWGGITHVQTENGKCAIAGIFVSNGNTCLEDEFKYYEVIDYIKYHSRFRDMGDYMSYMKGEQVINRFGE
jgi:hypothetical protein